MKLIHDFFTVQHSSAIEGGFVSTITLNSAHIIYTAHFPGYPVTPGVIQMQIVHELLGEKLGLQVKLQTMSQCKFVKILNPEETPSITITIKYHFSNGLKVSAWGENDGDVFFKLESVFQTID